MKDADIHVTLDVYVYCKSQVFVGTGPISVIVRASPSRVGGCGFDPRPDHTKDTMVPVATLLGTQHYKANAGQCLSVHPDLIKANCPSGALGWTPNAYMFASCGTSTTSIIMIIP